MGFTALLIPLSWCCPAELHAATTCHRFEQIELRLPWRLVHPNVRPDGSLRDCTRLNVTHKGLILLAVPRGFEPPTFGLGNRCSIRLSYGTNLSDNTM